MPTCAAVDPQRETVLEPDEVLTELHLPVTPEGVKSSYRKVRARASWDFALVGVALAVQLDGNVVRHARVVLSGVAATPWRSAPAEKALLGKRLDASTISAAADAAIKGAEPLTHNHYKIPMLHGLLIEQLEQLQRTP